jgi:alpha-L-fucosidase 2
LQGLWADGTRSAWNGDYHLNINLQMAYWAADPFGAGEPVEEPSHLPDVFEPLLRLLERLAESGRRTAREVYGCVGGGWTAHGFTDDSLRAGPYGGVEYAMCPTCGAWLALQLWDHASFVRAPLARRMLPILRGAVLFLAGE